MCVRVGSVAAVRVAAVGRCRLANCRVTCVRSPACQSKGMQAPSDVPMGVPVDESATPYTRHGADDGDTCCSSPYCEPVLRGICCLHDESEPPSDPDTWQSMLVEDSNSRALVDPRHVSRVSQSSKRAFGFGGH